MKKEIKHKIKNVEKILKEAEIDPMIIYFATEYLYHSADENDLWFMDKPNKDLVFFLTYGFELGLEKFKNSKK